MNHGGSVINSKRVHLRKSRNAFLQEHSITAQTGYDNNMKMIENDQKETQKAPCEIPLLFPGAGLLLARIFFFSFSLSFFNRWMDIHVCARVKT